MRHMGFFPAMPLPNFPVLDKGSPPWHLVLGGTFYGNAASDVLARLHIYEQVIRGMPFHYDDARNLSIQMLDPICQRKRGHSQQNRDALILGVIALRMSKP